MQQQSQIFVFSTALANKGAEAVRGGQFETIIAYHCAQPETRKFLQVSALQGSNLRGSNFFVLVLVLEISIESESVQQNWMVS